MKWLTRLWEKVNGNKTTIGTIVILLSQGMKVFFPSVIPAEQLDWVLSVGLTIGGIGVGHKGVKEYQKRTNSNVNK